MTFDSLTLTLSLTLTFAFAGMAHIKAISVKMPEKKRVRRMNKHGLYKHGFMGPGMGGIPGLPGGLWLAFDQIIA